MASALLVGAAAGAVLFAAPASAHNTDVTGVAKCIEADGQWEVTWTLTNDYGTPAKVTIKESTPTIASPVPDIPAKVGNVNGEIKLTVKLGAGVTKATISFTSEWGIGTKEHYTDDNNKSDVTPTGPCVAPTTPPAATPTTTVTKSPTPAVPAAPQLPVTGDRTWMLAVGGVAVLVIGVMLVVLVPRARRARAS